MRTGSMASLIVLPLFAATPALAQGTDAQRAACAGDAFRLCASSMPNADKVAVCLHNAKDRLSPACRGVFEAAGGGNDGSAKAAEPPAKDAVTAAPPIDTASEAAPKESATAVPPVETAQTPAPTDTVKVAPPAPVATAPSPDAVRAKPRAAPAASRPAARATPRPAVANRSTAGGATSKAAAKQTPRRPASMRFASKRQRGPRNDSDLAQARYWMKRITGVSIGNLAGLLPN